MPKQSYIGLALTAAVLSTALAGCSVKEGRSVIENGGQTTTVIESTDAIKPQKGAAKLIQTLENFEGYGWFDQSTIIGYQFASSVFGDDRGLAFKNLQTNESRLFEGYSGKPQLASLSLDGTKLALVKEGTGRQKPLVLLDLVKQSTLSYESGMHYAPWQFNWFEDGSGAALTPVDSQKNRLSLLDSEGHFTEQLMGYTPKQQQGERYISLGTTLGKQGQSLYFLVYSDDPGIYQFNLETQLSQQVLAMETISQFALAPKQPYMALTSFKKSGSGSELFIYSLEGKKVYELYKALNFSQLVWSANGKALVFEAIEANGESNLYLADMETGQTHFLGAYKGYSIKQMAFNPSSDQLMVTYVNLLSEADRIDTQILQLSR